MIIWNQYGILVVAFVMGCSFAGNLLTNYITGSMIYWDTHKWPLGVAMLIAALPCWFLGRWLSGRATRILVDQNTGETLIHAPYQNTLFFIRMHWWGPILFLIGLYLIINDVVISQGSMV